MRLKLFTLSICLLFLFGCASEDEVIEQLKKDAEDHVNLGKKQEGILIYEQVLNRKNDPEVQQRIQQLKSEQD